MSDTQVLNSTIFVSYARADSEWAKRLAQWLAADGFDVRMDTQDIVSGEPWRERLTELIAKADVFLFLISPDSITSEVCDWEVNEAERLQKRIFPVVCRETPTRAIPSRLSRLQFVFVFRNPTPSGDYRQLVDGLRSDTEWIREHTRIGQLAQTWDEAKRPTRLLLKGIEVDRLEAWRDRRTRDLPRLTGLQQAFLAESRRKRVQAQRSWIGGASIVSLALLVLAALVWVSRNDALESAQHALAAQKDAEQNFETAQNAVNSLIFDISQELKHIEGVKPAAVDRILTQSLFILDKLLHAQPDDVNLLDRKAAALIEFGDLYMRTGDTTKAETSYRQAKDIIRSLLRKTPDPNGVLRTRLSGSVARLGEIQRRKGEGDTRLESLQLALSLSKEALAMAPENSDRQAELAANLGQLGDYYWELANMDSARAMFEKALRLQKQVVDTSPHNIKYLINYSSLLSRKAELAGLNADTPTQRHALQQSLSAAQELTTLAPNNLLLKKTLATALSEWGRFQLWARQLDEALDAYQQAAQITKDIVHQDTNNVDYLYVHAVVHHEWSLANKAANRLDKANQLLAIAANAAKRFMAIEPNSPESIALRISILDTQVNISLDAGDFKSAKNAVEQAILLNNSKSDLLSKEPAMRVKLARVFLLGSKVNLAHENLNAAEKNLHRYLNIVKPLSAQYPNDLMIAMALHRGLKSMANIALQNQDVNSARRTLSDNTTLLSKLANNYPNNTEVMHHLSINHLDLAHLASKTGDLSSIDSHLRKSGDAVLAVLNQHPDNMEMLSEFTRVYSWVLKTVEGMIEQHENGSQYQSYWADQALDLGGQLVRAEQNDLGRKIIIRALNMHRTNRVKSNDLIIQLRYVDALFRSIEFISDDTVYQEAKQQLASLRKVESMSGDARLAVLKTENSGVTAYAWLMVHRADSDFAESVDIESLAAHKEALTAIDRALTQGLFKATVAAYEYGKHAWYSLLTGRFDQAEHAAKSGIGLDESRDFIYILHAHALMFKGQLEAAYAIHCRFIDRSIGTGARAKPWATVVREDFKLLRDRGHFHPGMAVIESTKFAEQC